MRRKLGALVGIVMLIGVFAAPAIADPLTIRIADIDRRADLP